MGLDDARSRSAFGRTVPAVAENVANSNDWPRDDVMQSSDLSIFGRKAKDSSMRATI